MKPANDPANETEDVGYDLNITKVTRQAAGSGTWVRGRLNGHRFDALVFPEHAHDPDSEMGDSRIAKLWIQRMADRQTVFNWDRGADIAARTDLAAQIVDFLKTGIADYVYAE